MSLIAGNVRSETEALTRKYSNAKAAYLDVHDVAEMARLIQNADVVIRCVMSSHLQFTSSE
jgi:alpha-aminoadipic semialdehyde synthase